MVNANEIIIQVLPIIKTIVFSLFGLGVCIAAFYYLLIIKRRRLWRVNIYEKKADGELHLVGKDRLMERKINKGKQVVYMLKNRKVETFPPPDAASHRFLGKEYADYLRVRDDYLPLRSEMTLSFLDNKTEDEKQDFYRYYKQKLLKMKQMTKEEVESNFIYIPVTRAVHAPLNFEVMEYDVNMMRINAIDNRDKIYKDKQDWLSKYGTYLALGGIIVLIIVVVYLSYDYGATVISSAMGQADKTLSAVETLAAKMGGTPPVS